MKANKINFAKWAIVKYGWIVVLLGIVPLEGGGTRDYWQWLIITSARQGLLPAPGMVIIFYMIATYQSNLFTTLIPRIGMESLLLNGYLAALGLIAVYVATHLILLVVLHLLGQAYLPSPYLLMIQGVHAMFLVACFVLFESTLTLKNRSVFLVVAIIAAILYYLLFSQVVFKEPYLQ